MRPTLFLFFSIIVFTVTLTAQQGNSWHFGHGNALDFSSGAPVPVGGSAVSTFEGCASLCDTGGQLLFYTNGGGRDPLLSGQSSGKIWNKQNQVLHDMGNTQGGGFSAAQSSVFIPKPGAPGRYYLFTMEEVEFDVGGPVAGQPEGRGLSYFELDATANGGLGAVVDYTEGLLLPSYEALCAVRQANGTDYWIMAINAVNGSLAVFSVTPSGITLYSQFFSQHSGWVKAAPDGRHIATVIGTSLAVYTFNAATGIIANGKLFPGFNNFAEFSPNGRYLYTHQATPNNQLRVLQFDLDAPNPLSTQQVVGVYVPASPSALLIPGQMQVAPDGSIYCVTGGIGSGPDSTYLSAIRCANTPNATLEQNIFGYASDGSGSSAGDFLGLPNFDNAYFYKTDTLIVDFPQDTVYACNNSVTLDPGLALPGYGFLWSTGATTPTVTVSAPGVYQVTVTNECGITGTASITVASGLGVTILPQGVPCVDNGYTLLASVGGSLGPVGYQWSGGGMAAQLPVNSSGTYTVTVSDGICTGTASFAALLGAAPAATVAVAQAPDPCAGGFATLTAGGGTSYVWSTGASGAALTVTQGGAYAVTASDAVGCTATAAANVTIATAPALELSISGVNPDCAGALTGEAALAIAAGTPPYAIAWSNGSATAMPVMLAAGLYTVTVTDAAACTATATLELTAPEPLDAGFDVSNPACDNQPTGEIVLQTLTGGLEPYFVKFQNDAMEPAQPGWQRSDLAAGFYSVLITDGVGCTLVRTFALTAPPAFNLAVDPASLTIELGETFPVTASTDVLPVGSLLAWTPVDGLSCTDCVAPIVTGLRDQTYLLTVTDPVTGCSDSASLRVRVDRNVRFYVPNVFSPNDDGQHDLLPVFAGVAVAEVETFEVYSRWGELVYVQPAPALNDETRGWNGRTQGKDAAAGVYVWRARLRLVDGAILERSGDVTLLR